MNAEVGVRAPGAEIKAEKRRSVERIICGNFKATPESAHPLTGLFPAVDRRIDTAATHENHMEESWIRDWGMNMIGMVESSSTLKKLQGQSELASQIDIFTSANIRRTLAFIDQPRW